MGVRTQETTAIGQLVPESLQLRIRSDSKSILLRQNSDYEGDLEWGTLGRPQKEGILREGQPVFASYTYAKSRIDSLVLTAKDEILLRQGESHIAVPLPPRLNAGEELLVNLWIPGRLDKLTMDNLYPVLESRYPEPRKPEVPLATRQLPKTCKKLKEGEPVTILAWGDSVTDGSFLSNPSSERWQALFVHRLCEEFPRAKITLITEAWGGHNTSHYFAERPGAEHSYQEKVLAVKPDLIVSEFVNDAWLSPEQVDMQYGRILKDFRNIGAEWIILTPHYVLPDWMGLKSQKEIDDDPRGYVKGLRAFAMKNGLALADASKRWGRLWRQGIPYMTLMLNAINHPDPRGMGIFVDSLMELF
jgi:lysophospholipase L1-like esterase